MKDFKVRRSKRRRQPPATGTGSSCTIHRFSQIWTTTMAHTRHTKYTSLVFFFLTNVPMSGLGLPRVGEGEEGEEAEEEEDNAGDGSPLSVVSGVRKKKKIHTPSYLGNSTQSNLAYKDSCVCKGPERPG